MDIAITNHAGIRIVEGTQPQQKFIGGHITVLGRLDVLENLLTINRSANASIVKAEVERIGTAVQNGGGKDLPLGPML